MIKDAVDLISIHDIVFRGLNSKHTNKLSKLTDFLFQIPVWVVKCYNFEFESWKSEKDELQTTSTHTPFKHTPPHNSSVCVTVGFFDIETIPWKKGRKQMTPTPIRICARFWLISRTKEMISNTFSLNSFPSVGQWPYIRCMQCWRDRYSRNSRRNDRYLAFAGDRLANSVACAFMFVNNLCSQIEREYCCRRLEMDGTISWLWDWCMNSPMSLKSGSRGFRMWNTTPQYTFD